MSETQRTTIMYENMKVIVYRLIRVYHFEQTRGVYYSPMTAEQIVDTVMAKSLWVLIWLFSDLRNERVDHFKYTSVNRNQNTHLETKLGPQIPVS